MACHKGVSGMLFDVAVWRVWSSAAQGFVSMPETVLIDAPNAFTAVEQAMRSGGLRFAGHVAAAAHDRSIVYRVYGVKLARWGGVETAQQASGHQASLGA